MGQIVDWNYRIFKDATLDKLKNDINASLEHDACNQSVLKHVEETGTLLSTLYDKD